MDIFKLYTDGTGIAELARITETSERTIQRRLKQGGVWIPGKKGIHRRKTTHTYNEHYFDSIDSEDRAYWLGFIAADGAITIDNKDRHYLRFHISVKDEQHLCKFRDCINSTYDIKTDGKSCRLVICGKRIVQSLMGHGLTPKKTRFIGWPPLPDNLLRHFCRGYFDGDGCWSIDKHGQIRFTLTGNTVFITEAQNILIARCQLSKTKHRIHSEHCHELVYGGNKACKRIFHFMYDGATVLMERKYFIASSILSDGNLPE